MVEVLGDSVKLHRFPIGPSSNQLYASFRGRLIKSSAGRAYSNQCAIWALKNKSALDKLREILRGKTLRVDCAFVFPREKLITKKNTLKKLDFTNRIKVCQDELAKIIGVDDAHFISGYCQKMVGDDSYVDITISVQNLER